MQQLSDHLRFLKDSFAHLDQLLVDLSSLSERPQPIAPAALAGVLQFADADFLRREVAQALAQSDTSMRQIADVVQAMRAIAGPASTPSLVDLNRAIQSTLTVSSNEWRAVAEVRTEFDASLPPVKCVPGDISLVIMGLLVNCAQALVAGNTSGVRAKGVITVTTRRNAPWAEVRIQHPAEITDETRRQLFDPAGAGHEVTTNATMALAHDIIVRRHGGSVTLEPGPDRGMAFVIRLPIGNDAEQSATAAA